MLDGKKIVERECPLCGRVHGLEVRERLDTVVIKDEVVEYKEMYYFCENEKEDNEFVDGKMLNANLLSARNAYRRKKGLLTSDEIVAIRNQYGLSQVDLANVLGWGEATISRYESKAIQDRSYDAALRKIKDDPNAAYEYLQRNRSRLGEKYPEVKKRMLERIDACGGQLISRQMMENVYIRYQEPSLFNGMKTLDIDKLASIINYFAAEIKDLYKVRLMKLLWYADSLHYKEYGTSMTGLVYCHNDMGALPEGHREMMQLRCIHVREEISGDENIMYHILPKGAGSPDDFTPEERNVLDRIIEKFKCFNAKKIAEYMYQETAYQRTQAGELISYEYAGQLRGF